MKLIAIELIVNPDQCNPTLSLFIHIMLPVWSLVSDCHLEAHPTGHEGSGLPVRIHLVLTTIYRQLPDHVVFVSRSNKAKKWPTHSIVAYEKDIF